MEEKTITLTENELQAKIDDAIKVATDKLISKHNGEMATVRKSYEDKIKQASMSAEEIAKQRAEELAQEKENELNELRTFKKTTILQDKISKAGLPKYFINDSRLLSAEEGDLDKLIKTVKSEYEETQPKGNTHSTVVQTSGAKPPKDAQAQAFEKFGEAIAELVK